MHLVTGVCGGLDWRRRRGLLDRMDRLNRLRRGKAAGGVGALLLQGAEPVGHEVLVRAAPQLVAAAERVSVAVARESCLAAAAWQCQTAIVVQLPHL